ncbi:hypothetical protein FSP39_007092 [Pinctada imbricata]|uniref:Uncharacterized protein n=1 Tax=Pinctada imbricata TaxID=66713 RepID=A0AA89C6T0_PINIB|nr:hypothetical protein FSP39_007092 [Pinctada imbricata]
MEGQLGRCRGILGALFPTYYWFKLDEATLTLSYAANQETIDEPLMEVDLMRISDGEDEEIFEEDIVESPDEENSSDFLPETESVNFKNHQMKPIPERIKERASRKFSATTGENIHRMVHEMKNYATKRTSEKGEDSISEDTTPTRFARLKQYVVAIDFGTTYSGYAFQHISDHERFPASGSTEMWKGSNGMSEKAPTSLLLTKDGTFEAFGYEAEKRYFELIENCDEEGWRFFKQFKMRIFQEKAGIDDDQAILAKEPEVAALYCKEKQLEVHHTNKRMSRQDNVFSFENGSKFVVLDLGGGTADVAVQQVIDGGKMKILRCASGGPWGGSKPNEEFMSIIRESTGRNSNEELLRENREEYYDLIQAWETKKRVSTGEEISDIIFKVPPGIISPGKDEDIETSRGIVRVLSSRGKIKLNSIIFKSLFDETVRHIVAHLKQMEQGRAFEDINVMFMVGGFSSSIFIKEAVRKAFPDMTIIVPKNPSLAVLFGAVAYGFQPNAIDARISSSHYGIEENGRFIQLIHKGQEIPVGVIVSSYKTKLVSCLDGFHIKIFASDEDIPPKKIEQCRSIGEIFLKMYRAHGKIEKEIEIEIYFDHTEMKVQATDVRTNRIFKTSCNFLE